ncbi:MAG: aminotransferase class V-fold PLP-dependent enzyme [Acetobacteraceae bacterium]|nr:aminotransferase class V-fold PLP-dependent enzyme [Acetobacteraceae bacterium]
MTIAAPPGAPLFDPAAFLIEPGIAHVCAGGKSAPLRTTLPAMGRSLMDKAGGVAGDVRQEAEVHRLLPRLDAFWGAAPGEMGLCASVAEGVAMLAESWDWREGDNVVVAGHEYPSLAAPFARIPGVELRAAPGLDGIAGAVDGRTRILAASSVSFLSGERADIPALRAVADRVGAALVLDHTQAAGWMPLDAGLQDFGFANSYKWMLGITGTCAAHWNRGRQPGWAPRSAGWHSLGTEWRPDDGTRPLVEGGMRFNRGNPNHAGVYALHAALDHFELFPRGAVAAHVTALAGWLRARCAEAGLPLLTPAQVGASICLPHPDSRAAVAAMAERGVWAWGGRGRIRVSFHGYNDAADAARSFDALRAVFG